MGTGTPVTTADDITAAKMNLKLETASMELVETITLTSAGTTFDFTELSTTTKYILLLSLDNNTASSANVALYVNNDTTATNYYYIRTHSYGSSHSVTTANTAEASYVLASSSTNAYIIIDKVLASGTAGILAVTSTSVSNVPATINNFTHGMKKTATITDITQLTVVASQNMKIGSKASLYKING